MGGSYLRTVSVLITPDCRFRYLRSIVVRQLGPAIICPLHILIWQLGLEWSLRCWATTDWHRLFIFPL